MDFLKKLFLTSIGFYSLILSIGDKSFAALTIPEVDPYAVIDQDRKKKDNPKLDKTRDQASEAKLEKEKKTKIEELPPYCDTAREFKQVYQELSSHALTEFPDREVVRISYEVTKGCDGAAQRFSLILNLLIKSGVDRKKSVEIALHFARRSDDQTTAFVLIFKGTFLEKYYDLDFKSSLITSLKLALNARGNPQILAEDFRSILDYCIDHKGAELPFKTCAPYSLELTNYSFLYQDKGLAESFKNLLNFFDQQKEIDFSISSKLKFAGRILRHGPKAVSNFQDQYAYGISEAMKLPQKVSLQLAVKVAENTLGRDLK